MTKTETHTNKTILRIILAAAAVLILCGSAVGFAGADSVLPTSGGELTGGDYYLDGDTRLQNNLTITGRVTIDLRGHVLKGTGNNSSITIERGGFLEVRDSNPQSLSHKFTGNQPGLLTWDENATGTYVEITGGCITGGGVYVGNHGGFKLEGGNIVGNTTDFGGGVYVGPTQSIFHMMGGSIVGNTADFGGGVFITGGLSEFFMMGGSITGNSAGNGGGVFVYSQFTMMGGSITGNTADSGGGVYMTGGCFSVFESPVISDNTKGAGASAPANNVYLHNGYRITVIDALTGGRIGIAKPEYYDTYTPFAQGGETHFDLSRDAQYFFPDSGSAVVKLEGSTLKWEVKTELVKDGSDDGTPSDADTLVGRGSPFDETENSDNGESTPVPGTEQTAEPTGKSPAPFFGILAGLGAAVFLFSLRRK